MTERRKRCNILYYVPTAITDGNNHFYAKSREILILSWERH